jgi:tRNA (guanine37-N1)-methyltransferase
VPLRIDILTIFPRMLAAPGRKHDQGRRGRPIRIRCVNLRDYATGAHLTTDDRPYGGGPGMVMKPEPVFKAGTTCAGRTPGCC